MKIIFDFDGVICQSQKLWVKKLNEMTGKHYTLNDWDVYNAENFGEDRDLLYETIRNTDLSEALPYSWTLRTIAQLQQYSDHIVQVCSRCANEKVFTAKKEFLDKNKIRVSFTPLFDFDKDVLPCDILIEDNFEVLNRALAKYKVLVSQPWNKNVDLHGTGIIRVSHGVDLYTKIWDLANKKTHDREDKEVGVI